MQAYSIDLRERAVASVESGECTVPEAAERYAISTASLERWLRRKRATGQCAPAPHAGGPARKLAGLAQVIRTAIAATPDITLAELCQQVQQDHGVASSRSMMCREVARLNVTVKKVAPCQSAGHARSPSAAHDLPSGRRGVGREALQVPG